MYIMYRNKNTFVATKIKLNYFFRFGIVFLLVFKLQNLNEFHNKLFYKLTGKHDGRYKLEVPNHL